MPALHWALGPQGDGLQGSASGGGTARISDRSRHRNTRRVEDGVRIEFLGGKRGLTLWWCRVTVAEGIPGVSLEARAHGHVIEHAALGPPLRRSLDRGPGTSASCKLYCWDSRSSRCTLVYNSGDCPCRRTDTGRMGHR